MSSNTTTKTLGIIIMLIGVAITLYTGFNTVPSENAVYMRAVQLTTDRDNNVNWGPYAGIGVYIIGGVFYFADRKKTIPQNRHSYNKSLHI